MKVKLARLKDKRTSDVLDFPLVENLGLGYLCSNLRKNGYDVEILDEEIQYISRKEILEKLNKADIIGFTATARPQIDGVLDVSEKLRKNGYKGYITVGGHFPTFMYKEILSNYSYLDSVVLYEGEETLAELVKAIDNNKSIDEISGLAFKQDNIIKKNPPRHLIHNLDLLPFPARDLSDIIIKRGGLSVISSSRGCYNNCSYCSISSFYRDSPGKSFRLRSAESVDKELRQIKKRFPDIKDIWFVDDNFVQKGDKGFERTEKICETLKSLGLKFDIYLRADDVNEKTLGLMKQNGLRSVFIGAEAGTDKTLKDIFNKKTTVKQTRYAINLCRDFNINVDPGFIMFHPWSTIDEIGKNIKFLKDIKEYTPYGIASFLTTFKFSPIGREMQSGARPYKPSRSQNKDLLQDDVPYEIQDPKVELLLDLTLKSFRGFKDLPKSLSKLKSKIRREDNKDLSRIYAKQVRDFSEVSMYYFEKLYHFLKRDSLRGIKDFFEELSKDIEDYTAREVKGIEGILVKNGKKN